MACANLSGWVDNPYMNSMDGDQIARIAFLGLLGAAVAGSYLMSQRGNMGKVAQQASIWGLIFVGVIAAVGMWGDIQQTVAPRQQINSEGIITVPRSPDGHYYLTLDINGVPIPFVIDTGASQVVLSQQDAARVGINPQELRYLGQASTANGTVTTATVTLYSVALAGVTESNVRAVVNGGPMDGSLLGMTYLNAFSAIRIEGSEMVLVR
jgi:aspartyl protease family protein